jgi:hypothetical protein
LSGGVTPYAQRVYDWERTFVEPGDPSLLSREDCAALSAAACRVLGIPVPRLRFTKQSSAPCWANPREWTVSISDWGRTRVTLLHELAHLGAVARGAVREDPHGPTFLRCAIDLYVAFLRMDVRSLEAGAGRFGLSPAAGAAVPVGRPASTGFFDGEF